MDIDYEDLKILSTTLEVYLERGYDEGALKIIKELREIFDNIETNLTQI